MSWVQVGPHKINTAQICYVEEEGDIVRVYFHGEWEGNPLDLHFDEAKSFWKHLKAENVMMNRDKGSATILPRVSSDKPADLGVAKESGATAALAPMKPKVASAGSSSSSSATPVVHRSIDSSQKHGDHHKRH